MTRWTQGEAEIEQQLAAGDLQQVTGSRSNGAVLLEKAQRTLDTRPNHRPDRPRQRLHPRLRRRPPRRHRAPGTTGPPPTSRGGHYALERALRGQFGQGFRAFGIMRRRRNELEYPDLPDETASLQETQHALDDAQVLIDAATKLLPSLAIF